MQLDCLMFELGRRCNFQCAHCLRGAAQDVSLDFKVIDKALDSVERINCLTLSGGEPMLYPSAIKYIVDEICRRDISVDYFFIATNGTIFDITGVSALLELYSICCEKEMCELKISADKYHRQCHSPLDVWSGLAFARYDEGVPDKYLKKEGRAETISEAYNIPEDNGVVFDDENNVAEGIVYVNALGDVLTECDYSYEHQQLRSYGNLNNSSLEDILYELSLSSIAQAS